MSEFYHSNERKQIADKLQTVLTRCHNTLRNKEGMSPESAFRELNKLLFIKYISEKDEKGRKNLQMVLNGENLIYPNNSFPLLFDNVIDEFKEEQLFENSETIIANYSICLDIYEALRIFEFSSSLPEIGDAYESFIQKVFRNTGNTMSVPKIVVDFIVDYLNIKSSSNVIDPFCSYGGMLTAVAVRKPQRHKGRLLGYERDTLMAQTAKMNLLMHGDFKSIIERKQDHYRTKEETFDFVLTCIGQNFQSEDEINSIYGHLKPMGLASIIIPDEFLQKSQYYFLRRRLLDHFIVKAIISLPLGAIKSGIKPVKTSVLIMQSGSPHSSFDKTLFAKVENIGVSVFGLPTENNDFKTIEPIVVQLLQKGIKSQSKSVMWVNLRADDVWNVEAEFSKVENRIPTRYPIYRLGELVKLRTGEPFELVEKEYKRITVGKKKHNVTLRDKINAKDIKNKNRQMIVHSDEILVSRIGAKDGAIGIVPKSLDGAIVSNNFIILNIRSQAIDPYYLLLVLTSERYKKLLGGISRGFTPRSYIKDSDLLNLEIPVPELSEQIELSSKLEGMQKRISILEKKWNEGVELFSKKLFEL